MKKNKYVSIIVILFLTGCNGWSKDRYYESYYNGELAGLKWRKQYKEDDNANQKEYCVYNISYFLPINFWNFRISDKQYIKKAIKDLNKEGIAGLNMRDIYINDTGIGTPIFSYYCNTISGVMIE
jgi:hypothetical protein